MNSRQWSLHAFSDIAAIPKRGPRIILRQSYAAISDEFVYLFFLLNYFFTYVNAWEILMRI